MEVVSRKMENKNEVISYLLKEDIAEGDANDGNDGGDEAGEKVGVFPPELVIK